MSIYGTSDPGDQRGPGQPQPLPPDRPRVDEEHAHAPREPESSAYTQPSTYGPPPAYRHGPDDHPGGWVLNPPRLPRRRPRRRPWLTWVVAVFAACALTSGGGILALSLTGDIGKMTQKLAPDPGLRACRAIAASAVSTAPRSPRRNMTQAEYQQVRKQFAESRHADIRDAGTKAIDLLWQVEQAGDNPAAVLTLAGPMITAYASLSGACAAHGVVLPPLGGPSAKAGG